MHSIVITRSVKPNWQRTARSHWRSSTPYPEGDVKELKVVVKADVQGSAEAVADTLTKLSTEACRLIVIHSGVGGITETDISLAAASDAIVLGFNVRPHRKPPTLPNSKVLISVFTMSSTMPSMTSRMLWKVCSRRLSRKLTLVAPKYVKPSIDQGRHHSRLLRGFR